MSVPREATRSALALVLVIHAVAHLPGVSRAMALGGLPGCYPTTTAFNGAIDVGESGVRLVGVLWLFNAVGIVAAAVLVFRGNPHWPPLTVSMLVFSLMLCTLGLPETRIGLAVDVVLLLAVILTIGAV